MFYHINEAENYHGYCSCDLWGGGASNLYLSMVNNKFVGDKKETISNLLKYCERDTEGMVVIYKELLNV